MKEALTINDARSDNIRNMTWNTVSQVESDDPGVNVQRSLLLVLLIASMHEPTQLDKGELNWCQKPYFSYHHGEKNSTQSR